jgi:hypothetical protein
MCLGPCLIFSFDIFVWGVGSLTRFFSCVVNECVMLGTSVLVWISVGGIPEPLVQGESTHPTGNGIAKYPCLR